MIKYMLITSFQLMDTEYSTYCKPRLLVIVSIYFKYLHIIHDYCNLLSKYVLGNILVCTYRKLRHYML